MRSSFDGLHPPRDGDAVSPDERERLYAALMQRTYDAGVFLRTESVVLFPNLAPEYNRHNGEPRIRIVRPTGEFFHEKPEGAELATLMSGATNIDEEISIIAHELGHHFCPADTEEIRERLNSAPQSVTEEERRAVYSDELLAWDWARTELTKLRHPDMAHFEMVRAKLLGTYEAMWPNGVPSG